MAMMLLRYLAASRMRHCLAHDGRAMACSLAGLDRWVELERRVELVRRVELDRWVKLDLWLGLERFAVAFENHGPTTHERICKRGKKQIQFRVRP